MNKFTRTLFFTLPLICMAGCVVVGSQPVPQPLPEDKTVIAEIDAAGALMFDDAKARAFSDIATRSFLSADAQVHLVNRAMDSLMFDNAKQQVLLKLIDNPYFVQEGKKAVLDHLDEFMFDSARQAILQAISRRGRIPSAAELTMLHRPENHLPSQTPVETELTVTFESSHGSNL